MEFLIPTTTIAGIPRYIPKFNAITEIPILNTSDSELAFSINDNELIITPMISSLSLMENAESESEVLGIGISVIMLNLGMYLGIPAIVVVGIRKSIF